MFLIISKTFIQRSIHEGRKGFTIKPLILSDIGEGIQEVKILELMVKEGDFVKEFDPICEVQSDKACVRITSRYDGKIGKINFKEGENCLVGKSLLSIMIKDNISIGNDDKDDSSNDNDESYNDKDDSSNDKDDYSSNGSLKYRDHNLSIFERGMMKKMNESLSIPHFYIHDRIKIGKVKKKFTAIFIKALSNCLLRYPRLNAHYLADKEIIREWRGRHNISIAIDTKQGLQIPSIKDCQDKSINEIEQDIIRLRSLSREGKLSKEDLSDGTVCVSNIGSLKKGGIFANPLIVAPQVMIVSLMEIDPSTNEVPISIGADHRIIDGSMILFFLEDLRSEITSMS